MTAPIDVDRLRAIKRELGELAGPLRDPEPLRMLFDDLLDALISHEEWRNETEAGK
jgi:hypothetical protein